MFYVSGSNLTDNESIILPTSKLKARIYNASAVRKLKLNVKKSSEMTHISKIRTKR